MIFNELISLILVFALGVICSISDIRKGYIYNKILLVFFALGGISAVLYYILFARDYLLVYVSNLIIVSVCALALYYTHSFAGGDTKLVILMSLIFPARFYIIYDESQLTLVFVLCFALFLGYLYLLFTTVLRLIKKKSLLDGGYFKSYLIRFVKSYFVIMPYVVLLTLISRLLTIYVFQINTLIEIGLCFILAWSINKSSLMKKWYVIIPTLIVDVILSVFLKIVPISLHPGNYVFTIVLVLFQMIIRTGLYNEIPTESVKASMILSTASSMLMQNSRVKNLPGISKENLKDRLTEEQAASIRRWGKTPSGQETVFIVRKIPFAVFLTIGYFCYLILWGLLV